MDPAKRELDALCAWPIRLGRSDTITPHKITVVFLVQEFISLKQPAAAGQPDKPPLAPRFRRQFAMLLLKLIQMPDISYRQLHIMLRQPAYALHPAHLASFEKMISVLSSQGIEVLFDLQKFIETLITETSHVNHNSLLGHYVRRIVLVLDKLGFAEMMELYQQIRAYYERGVRSLARRPPTPPSVTPILLSDDPPTTTTTTTTMATSTVVTISSGGSADGTNSSGNISVDSVAAGAANRTQSSTMPMAIDIDDIDLDAEVVVIDDDDDEDQVHEEERISDDVLIIEDDDDIELIEEVHSSGEHHLISEDGASKADEEDEEKRDLPSAASFRCWSQKQADLFVAQQCYLLENDEPRALAPRALQRKLEQITGDNPLYAQAHTLSYMNCLRMRDVLSAAEAFHRAFDRTAVRAGTPKGFQYSSLNLAIRHAQFEHHDEALVSLRECVMLAQECGDRVCLQLAQSWLCLLDRNYVQLCERSVSAQTELSLVHSVSLGVQFIVNVAAVAGFRPARLFELLMKSEVINFQHSLMDLMANCLAQKAALWTLYGKTEVASLCSQLLLHVVRSHNTAETGSIENGEGVCHALCCAAMRLSLRGDYTHSALILQHARDRFPRDPLSRTWMLCDAYITSVQAMHRLRWDEAATACSQLYTLNPAVSRLQRATLRLRRGDRWGAERILRRQLLADERLEPLHRVRAWMLLAQCSDGLAAVNTLMEASVFAGRMYLAYEEAMIDVHLAHLLLQMAQPKQALRTVRRCMNTVLTDGGVYDVARMEFVFVRALVAAEEASEADEDEERGGATETAEALGGEGRTRDLMALRLDECDEIIGGIVEKFSRVEATAKVKDVYVWLALTNHACGRQAERNRWARKLRELERWSPTPAEYANVFY